MKAAEAKDTHEERLDSLLKSVTSIIYTNVCRGLFEKDKMKNIFLISTSINKNAGDLKEDIWSLFLRGAGVIDKDKNLKNPEKTLIGTP